MTADRELHRALADIRQMSISEHEKGQRFERLMLGFLRVAPHWATKLRHGWLWSDWQDNAGEVDIGIDRFAIRSLVAKHSWDEEREWTKGAAEGP